MLSISGHKINGGRLVSTPAVRDWAAETGTNLFHYIGRHLNGDWGDLSEEDKQANDRACQEGDRLFSSYVVDKGLGRKIWIITEADRSTTTVLFPEEY